MKERIRAVLPPVEVLRKAFEYDPSTGRLRWRISLSNRVLIGDLAGHIVGSGTGRRRGVKIHGRRYTCNRIIWKMITGKEPQGDIDHIDGNSLNDRFHNLRDVTRSVNNLNVRKKSHNSTGYANILYDPHRKSFFTQIKISGKAYYTPRNPDILQAVRERDALYARLIPGVKYGH